MTAREKAAEAASRGDVTTERFWLNVAEVVDQAPPLAPEQAARLRILVAPNPVPRTVAAA
ncbi:hypothetical protein ACFRDV_16655 [Streptomyces fagopyri]|uniref:hypothetical protein n=1 Tax=Streptomyces fagopyri TaxID=2662397 RepID=UPI0036B9ED72